MSIYQMTTDDQSYYQIPSDEQPYYQLRSEEQSYYQITSDEQSYYQMTTDDQIITSDQMITDDQIITDDKHQIITDKYIVYPYLGQVTMLDGKFIRPHSRSFYPHRIIYQAFHNVVLKSSDRIFFKNKKKGDNRITNLYLCNFGQAKITKINKPYGVYYKKKFKTKKWLSVVQIKKKAHFIGHFKTEHEAKVAYNMYVSYFNRYYNCKYVLNEINEKLDPVTYNELYYHIKNKLNHYVDTKINYLMKLYEFEE